MPRWYARVLDTEIHDLRIVFRGNDQAWCPGDIEFAGDLLVFLKIIHAQANLVIRSCYFFQELAGFIAVFAVLSGPEI